ncbi:unnamed protein product [Rangifer tarandus platyrhynchus]|uniref:Uncharacterized protein n=1 Tax=Rangifer tarandus platyrhynchus TaxID=3082113 RepID=A0AC59ZPN3_RANTA
MASQGGSAQRPGSVIRDGQAPASGMDQPPWRVGPACGDSRECQDHREEGLGDEPPGHGCEKCGGGGDGWEGEVGWGAGRQADPTSPRRPRSGVQRLPGLEGARSHAGEPRTREQPALTCPAKGCSTARPGHPAGGTRTALRPRFCPHSARDHA